MGLALLSAALLLLSSPGFDLAALAWIGLIPLLVAIRGAGALMVAALGMLAGFAYHFGLVVWTLPLPGTSVWNLGVGGIAKGTIFLVFLLTARFLQLRLPAWSALSVPTAWVLMEWGSLHLDFASVPWGPLGYSQYTTLPVAQVASVAGVYGVSFLIVAANALLLELALALAAARRAVPSTGPLWRRAAPSCGLATLLAGVALLFGLRVHAALASDPDAPELRLAVVQGNDVWRPGDDLQRRMRTFSTYLRLSRETQPARPGLVVWPSSSVPAYIPRETRVVAQLGELAREMGTWILVGSSGLEKMREQNQRNLPANSAFLFSPDGEIVAQYDKIRLLPFDEYVPLRGILRWPSWIVDSSARDFRPGERRTIFQLGEDPGDPRFGVQICWENAFPDLFREIAAKDVDFMVSMTNEAFTDSAFGQRSLLALNVFRAIENRVSIARPASTGITAFIGPDGGLREVLTGPDGNHQGVAGSLLRDLPLSRKRSFYNRHGDRFCQAVALGFVGFLAAACLRRPGAGSPSPGERA